MNKIVQNISPASTTRWTRNPGWWALIVSTCAFIFSGFALYLSYSDPSRQSAEAILEQSPDVIIDWQLNDIEIGEDKVILPYLWIRNIGSIAASQVRIWIFKWKLFSDIPSRIYSSQSQCEWVFPILEPFKDTLVMIPSMCLTPLPKPKSRNIVEIRFEYRRDVDLKRYAKRSFAILSNSNVWQSVYSLPNDSMKQTLQKILDELPVEEPWNWDHADPVEIDD